MAEETTKFEYPSNSETKAGPETPLESWKEIAAYLQRDVRTVIRWEKKEGLPVRRHLHQARSSVYVFSSELDAWRASRRPTGQVAEQSGRFAPSGPVWRLPVPSLAFALVIVLALVSVGGGPILNPEGAWAKAPRDPNAKAIRQIWASPGEPVDATGSPSPDGRFLAIVDWSTGDLAIRDLATGENRLLTDDGPWEKRVSMAMSPVFSPDGSQIAYLWETWDKVLINGLRLIDVPEEGQKPGPPRVLYSSDEVRWLEPAGWTPDGNDILAFFAQRDHTSQIVTVSVADGSVTVLKSLGWSYPNPKLSPDGRWIAYDFPPLQDSPNRDIFILARDGSRELVAVKHPANDFVLGWAPAGDALLFASDRTGKFDIWSIPVSEGQTAGPPQLLKRDIGFIQPMGITSDGTFYYGLLTGMVDIYSAEINAETGKLLRQPTRVSELFQGGNASPEWSPDGDKLIYLSERGTRLGPYLQSGTLVIRSWSGGEERELKAEGLQFNPDYINPRWAPGGKKILVRASDAADRRGVYTIDVGTGKASLIERDRADTQMRSFAWSPDGKKLFHVRRFAEEDVKFISGLYARDLETGRDREIYRVQRGAGGKILGPAPSPDGRRIAFRLLDSPSDRLMVLSTSGSEPRELYKAGSSSWISGVTWGPMGRYVYFGKAERKNLLSIELWRVPVEGSKAEKTDLAGVLLRGLRFHPDGRHIAFQAGRRETEVWVMENFLPALRASR